MKIIELSEAKSSLATYANEVSGEPLVIAVDGKPVAALVSLENTDFETISLSMNPQFLTLIEHSRARQQREGGISSKEMRRRLGVEQAG
jgi:antitoxin (DNA-binding transcriptional repressor) of toxin-antitoxin stability system